MARRQEDWSNRPMSREWWEATMRARIARLKKAGKLPTLTEVMEWLRPERANPPDAGKEETTAPVAGAKGTHAASAVPSLSTDAIYDFHVGGWEPLSSPKSRRLPKNTQFLLTVNRGYNGLGALDEEFHVERVGRDHKWRLWQIAENQAEGGIETWPVAEFSGEGFDPRAAAEELLVALVADRGEAYWSSGEPDATVEQTGLLLAADWDRVVARAMKESRGSR